MNCVRDLYSLVVLGRIRVLNVPELSVGSQQEGGVVSQKSHNVHIANIMVEMGIGVGTKRGVSG